LAPVTEPAASSELESARERAEDAFRRGELDEALKLFKAILFQFESRLGPAERAEFYVRLGRVKAGQKDARQARNFYDKALVLDAAHRPAIEGLVDLFTAENDAEHLVEWKRRLAELLTGEDRVRQLLEAGDACAAKLRDVSRAVLLYQEALSTDPAHKMAQLKLFQTCRDAAMWPEAIAACEHIVAGETDTKKKATWHYFLATTFRDQVQDDEHALEEFERVLDVDPEDAESLGAIEAILSRKEDWTGLDAAWRRMLERLPARGAKARCEMLLHKLGENAHQHLGDLAKAAEHFRRALELNPDHRARRELLAGLYAQLPERWADAVREHQRLLRGDPKRIDSYHQMRGILRDAGRPDEVWCVCAALVHLERADPTEVQFYEQYRPKGALSVPGSVDPEAWPADLYHPDEDRALARLCGALAPAVVRATAQSQKSFGLRKKDQQDPRTSPLALAKALRQASAALDIPVPELYVVPHQQGGLIIAATEPPASVAGQDFLAGLAPAELRFVAARHIAAYRREHRVPYLLAVSAAGQRASLAQLLAAWVDAAVALCVPDAPVERTAEMQRVLKLLQANLKPMDLELLRPEVQAVAARHDRDVVGLRAADLTSDRAALLLCGDLSAATKMIPRAPALAPDLADNRRGDELLLFAVDDTHFRLRRALGIALPSE